MRTAHHWLVGFACLLALTVAPPVSAQGGKVRPVLPHRGDWGTPVVFLSGGPGIDVD